MRPLAEIEREFHAEGPFNARAGARARGGAGSFCNTKLCLVATDREYLVRLLYDLSEDEHCHRVKYSREPREGMYLGRAFFADAVLVGELWARLKRDLKLMCTVQDDDFTLVFRERFHGWRRPSAE